MNFEVTPWRPEHRLGTIETIKSVYDDYGFGWDPSDYHADLYDVPAHYFEAGHYFWVAEMADTVVGTVAVTLFPSLPGAAGEIVSHEGYLRVAGTDCDLNRLYVRASTRRLGIGRRLFEKAISTAKERGCQAMEIWSDKRFSEAHQLYQAYGAVVVGERICDDPDVSPEWGLRLQLRN